MKIKKLIKIKHSIFLIFILIFALVLRLIFFVGLANTESQDDGVYINFARIVTLGQFSYDKTVLTEQYSNPVMILKTRSMMIYPTAFFFYIFGINDYSAVLWPLLSSLGSIVVIYYLGKLLVNEKVGLLSAFLLSFFPLDVINATRILPDIPATFFSILSVSVFFYAEKRNPKKK